MLKYGQFVKLTKVANVSVSVSWNRIVENFRSVYPMLKQENDRFWAEQFILPVNTVGLLKQILVNQHRQYISMGIPDPVTKRITNVTLTLNSTEHVSFDVSEAEKRPLLKAQAKFIASKVSDNFKALDLIDHAKNYTE